MSLTEKKLFYVELSNYKPFPNGSTIKIAGFDCDITCVTSIEAAQLIFDKTANFDIFVCNAPTEELFKISRSKNKNCINILLTDKPMEEYSKNLGGHEEKLIDHLIANHHPSEWTAMELVTTIQKIVRNNIWGIEKYLTGDYNLQTAEVRSSDQRESLNLGVMKFAEEHKLGSFISKSAYSIAEEFLMNAIYDAPVAGGKQIYSELSRTTIIKLQENEYSKLKYAYDGKVFAISITDPFGAMKKDIFNKYVKKIINRSDSQKIIDIKEGGAGLGLMKILYGSHSLICNLKKGEQTEFIALFNPNKQVRDFVRMPRTLGFFEEIS